MATQPIPPDRIEPVAPPELPDSPSPAETPVTEPPGFEPLQPDRDTPEPSIPELPPTPD